MPNKKKVMLGNIIEYQHSEFLYYLCVINKHIAHIYHPTSNLPSWNIFLEAQTPY